MFSRVHVDDISLVLSASIAAPRPGAVYNVADDKPEAGHVVTEFACGLLGLKPPPLVSFEESGMRSPCSLSLAKGLHEGRASAVSPVGLDRCQLSTFHWGRCACCLLRAALLHAQCRSLPDSKKT